MMCTGSSVTFSLSFINSSSWPRAAKDTLRGSIYLPLSRKYWSWFEPVYRCCTLGQLQHWPPVELPREAKLTWVQWEMPPTWFAISLLCLSSSQGLEKSRLCLLCEKEKWGDLSMKRLADINFEEAFRNPTLRGRCVWGGGWRGRSRWCPADRAPQVADQPGQSYCYREFIKI